jgi:MFS family permease
VLFLGRVLQSLSGSATWVVGFALLATNVKRKNLGSSMGMAMSFVTAGTVAGPTLSGALLQLFGYWATWSLPIVLLTFDIIGRLLMIEPQNVSTPGSDLAKSSDATPNNDDLEVLDESTTLLSNASPNFEQNGGRWAYFRAFLSDARVLTGLANILIVASLLSGINNTLPVHLREAFGWNSLLVSTMFFCIQIPNILLGGIAGWLRDRLGLRRPTTLGWLVIVPLILLLGAPGDPRFPWASGDTAGKPIFTGCAIGLGSVLPLVRGVGAVQLACE